MNAKPRQFQPKMFQTSGERCSVALLRQYINRRPRNLKASDPFYLSIKYNSGPGDKTWFKVQPMGENKNNSMMKTSSPKQPFSHLRSGLPITVPAKRSLARWRKQISRGHPLQKSLVKEINDYDEADEDKKQQLSWAILMGSSKPKPVPVSFTNCTVTFNLKYKALPVKLRKGRFYFIESDSDTDWTITELFDRTLNFFASWRFENIILSYCFDRLQLFWQNA